MQRLLGTLLFAAMSSSGCTPDTEIEETGKTPEETDSTDCVSAGGTFLSTDDPLPECCEGTTAVSKPRVMDTEDRYDGPDMPDECAPSNAPLAHMVCMACGDDTCDADLEHVCNCPADCAP